MLWVAGPWIWDTSARPGPCWRPPAGMSGLDLRPLPLQSQQGGTPGMGVFFGNVQPSAVENRSDYTLLGQGNWHDIKPTTAQRNRIARRTGFTPTGDDLVGILLSIMTDGASPDGSDGPLPIVATQSGRVELHCGSARHHERFRWGGRHTVVVRQTIRRDFAELWERDQTRARKVLGGLVEKYGESDWKEFVPAALQPHVEGPLKPETTITENFTRADSTTLMGNLLSWTQVSGTWGTYSNAGYKVSPNNTNQFARAESDLSSSDHYAQAVLSNSVGGGGPAARFSSSAETCYCCGTFGAIYLIKFVAGAQTNLSNTTYTFVNGDTHKVECNGSTIKQYINAVEKLSVSDSAISGNTRGGMYAYSVNQLVDDFEAADLGGGGGGIIYTQLERGIRGYARGTFEGSY